ncbi:MAG: Eco57I restriction-modification methylase domain-containing protein [Candidatus Hodarchaeota archaeon]
MISSKQKQRGCYYTPEALSLTITRWTLEKPLNQFLHQLSSVLSKLQLNTAQEKLVKQAQTIFKQLASLKICDPAMGMGVFLISAFLFLSEFHTQIIKKSSLLPDALKDEILRNLDFFKDEGQADRYRWQKHVLRSCLYGVDVSNTAVEQTITNLSSISNIESDEWHVGNLKVGNALLIPSKLDLRKLEDNFHKKIAEIINHRIRIQGISANSQSHYNEIKTLKNEILSLPNYQTLRNLSISDLGNNDEVKSPFEWPIEFPEIFFDERGHVLKNPGFDITITNPPWEAWKPIDNEFFSQFDPNFKNIKLKTRQMKSRHNLLLNPDIRKQFEEKRKLYKELGIYYRSTYRNQGRGDLNLYKLFFELCWKITKTNNGRVGILVPSGILGDFGTLNLRKMIFQQSRIERITEIITGKEFFPEIHRELGLSIIIYEKGTKTTDFLYDGGIKSLQELNTRTPIKLLHKYVVTYAPESLAIPMVQSPGELTILEKLYQFPPLGHELWNLKCGTEFHRTNHANYFSKEKTDIPLLEGKYITRFGYTLDNIQLYAQGKDLQEKIPSFRLPRVVWRAVSDRFLRRRMFVSVIPPGIALANSLNYMISLDKKSPPEKLYYLAGVMNSLVFEYRVRQLSFNQNLNHYVVRSIPVPLYNPDHALCSDLVNNVISIIPKANKWAQILVFEGKKAGKRAEEQLFSALALIDIQAARLYSLAPQEFNLILEKFPKLSKNYIEQIYNSIFY